MPGRETCQRIDTRREIRWIKLRRDPGQGPLQLPRPCPPPLLLPRPLGQNLPVDPLHLNFARGATGIVRFGVGGAQSLVRGGFRFVRNG